MRLLYKTRSCSKTVVSSAYCVTEHFLTSILSLYYNLCFSTQRLRETMQYESQVKNDKHIFSFALYELAMIHISKEEVGRNATSLLLFVE